MVKGNLSRLILGLMLVVLLLSVTGVATAASGVPNAKLVRHATSVVFTGVSGQPGPTITVNGVGFGSTAPAGTSAAVTSCGTYADNGNWWGRYGLWFYDDTHQWEAGRADGSGGGNCIGIKLVSWSNTKVVFSFGNSYGSFDHWTADPGDNYVIALKGYFWGGVVSYS